MKAKVIEEKIGVSPILNYMPINWKVKKLTNRSIQDMILENLFYGRESEPFSLMINILTS